jgi:3-hydroxymyristoyl/3-hydroxydecanoyl-(acyl carrier protein) dehydratase
MTINHQLEQRMATYLPVPPALPKITEALERVPLGVDLVGQIPPEPLSVSFDLGSQPARDTTAQLGVNGVGATGALPRQQRAPSTNDPKALTHYGVDGGAYNAVQPSRPVDKQLPEPTVKRAPVGLTLDRHGLRVHASGKISDIYGPAFAAQDNYFRQVRMPEPPLLLADRLLGIDAEPGKSGTGTLWTETDVTANAWWLHQGRMPAGIMIEAGQADLMLISWMGADFANKSDRVYRLLGCEVTYLGGLPEIGDTLRFDIHVDGHARQGAIRMFFFHYDCTIDGVERMSMRNGQAGFFSDEELAASGGTLWRPEDETVSGPVESTRVQTSRSSLHRADLEAMAAGEIWHTFGRGFERAASHTRTPRISGGDMLFVDEVSQLDFSGGPWGRGYLRAVEHVAPEKWYFAGHFKNDPCMPGALMYEATIQTMAIYMTALGMTLDCDGWRFEPVPFATYKLVCRGQVTPQSRELVYEVFVREVLAGPEPTLFADLLCTVDGLPAFHCRRMGLRLSPGCPMDMGVEELAGYVEPKAVAEADGVKFDYKAMLACAIAKHSLALGPRYEKFDTHRRFARLPGPPYHFMSRVTEVIGELGTAKSGAQVVAEYDVPSDAWYFAENKASNGKHTMPNAVLMEIALQPAGWLGAYVGCPLDYDVDLFFRNLDGTGVQHREVTPSTGTLRIKATLKNIAAAGGTIIVTFGGEISADEGLIYTFDTVFGYFRLEALQQQVGLPVSEEQRYLLELPCESPVVDLRTGPEEFFGPGARLADPMLLMLDRVTGRWPTDGSAGLGRWRGVKDVDPAEWFFKAHFYQDPVQPGSLGIEMLLQLLQFAMLDLGLGKEVGPSARFEPVALHEAVTWRYRGQVVPTNKQITSQVEITRIARDDDGVLAVADASLWVDGIRIYSATNLGMRITCGEQDSESPVVSVTSATPFAASTTTMETTIDPARDTWVADHCPSFVIPSLPMMSVLDLFAQAAGRAVGAAKVVEITDLQLVRWVIVDSPKHLRVVIEPVEPRRFEGRLEVWRDAPRPELSRWETHAQAVIGAADHYQGVPPTPAPLKDTVPFADPYDGTLFHGPAFATLMDGARIGHNGSSGTLAVDRCKVPVGQQQPGLLDGALHIVPHNAMSGWTTDGSYSDATDPHVGIPRRIIQSRFYSDPPMEGTVDVEARFVGFDDGNARMPIVDLWLSIAGKPWAYLRLVEFLLVKGPLAQASGPKRRAFLTERRAVPAMSLSDRLGHGVVTLDSLRAAAQDWLKGTLRVVYDTDSQGDSLIADIATKEAVADAAHSAIHPSQVHIVAGQVSCPSLPLERISVEVEQTPQVACRASASLQTDWESLRSWSYDRLGLQQGGFGDLLHWALLSRYVRHVIITDPAAIAAVRGRPVLLLGNHQVQIESVLGTTIASWLTATPVATIAHVKHETRWVGDLSRLLDATAGKELTNVRYFDQRNPQQFFSLVEEIKSDAATHGASTMVHADGTRHVRSGQRVEKLTSTLLDMAIEVSMPIVPMYFAGGLPEVPVDRKLEVPYRHAAQDYIFGRPIMPEELTAWTYADRRRRVMDAINALAPFSDAPHEPNYAVENRIAAAAPGAPTLATIWECFEDALDALPVHWRDTLHRDQ